jgi:hypothetical protein
MIARYGAKKVVCGASHILIRARFMRSLITDAPIASSNQGLRPRGRATEGCCGPKVYSLHAPEVECIDRGKARAPYEFGCKVSTRRSPPPKGGQCVPAKALHGNPYDGHTLGPVIADLEKLTDVAVRRILRQGLSWSQPSGSVQGLDHRARWRLGRRISRRMALVTRRTW